MESKKTETDITYWHPAFYADIQIEFAQDADHLKFESEHQLGTNPMEIDVLVIKKQKDIPVKKNIGRIFRKYNVIEYKSPDDFLSVDDFYKVYGYTCFYKADVPLTDSIPIQELTISFVTEKYPRKLIRHLREVKEYVVKQKESGIYYVYGDLIPIQLIVTKELSWLKNLWLKSLTNKLYEIENAKKLMIDYAKHSENKLYRSVLETIIRANSKTFEEVNEMGDIFMEIVQEKFDRRLEEAVQKAVEEKTENIKRNVTESITKDVTESVTKSVTESVTKSVTESVTKSVTKSVTQKTKLIESISLILKKCRKNKPLSVIADELETEPDKISFIYNIICHNAEKSVEELYELADKQLHNSSPDNYL